MTLHICDLNLPHTKLVHIPFKYPQQVKELVPLEDDLIELVKNLRFRKIDNKFHRTLAKDMKGIRSSNKTLTAAEKTLNMHGFSKQNYSNILQNAITSKYKKNR